MTTIILEDLNDDLVARFQAFAKDLNVKMAIIHEKNLPNVENSKPYNPPKTFHQALLNIPKLEGYSDEEVDEIFGRKEHYSPHREIDWGTE